MTDTEKRRDEEVIPDHEITHYGADGSFCNVRFYEGPCTMVNVVEYNPKNGRMVRHMTSDQGGGEGAA